MDFQVDIEGLGALEKNLDRASENLRRALDAMRDVSEESPGYLDNARPSLNRASKHLDHWQDVLARNYVMPSNDSPRLVPGPTPPSRPAEQTQVSLEEILRRT